MVHYNGGVRPLGEWRKSSDEHEVFDDGLRGSCRASNASDKEEGTRS